MVRLRWESRIVEHSHSQFESKTSAGQEYGSQRTESTLDGTFHPPYAVRGPLNQD